MAPKLKRLLFVPDTHRPYHDKRAWKLLLKAARVFRPQRTIIGGDFWDGGCVSPHDGVPSSHIRSFDEEIDDVNTGLDELEEATGSAEKDFVEGNHELWLPRLLAKARPTLANSRRFSVPSLLRLKERGWSYTPFKRFLKVGKLYVTHTTGKSGANAHKQAQLDFWDNVAMFHTHHMAIAYRGTVKGTSHVAGMFGWLGDEAQADYMHRVVMDATWQKGFGIGFEEENGTVHLQAVPIINYRVVIAGKLVCG